MAKNNQKFIVGINTIVLLVIFSCYLQQKYQSFPEENVLLPKVDTTDYSHQNIPKILNDSRKMKVNFTKTEIPSPPALVSQLEQSLNKEDKPQTKNPIKRLQLGYAKPALVPLKFIEPDKQPSVATDKKLTVLPQNVVLPKTILKSSKITENETKIDFRKELPKKDPVESKAKEILIENTDLSNGIKILTEAENKQNFEMEIFWPESSSASQKLFKTMNKCFGMRVAVLDNNGEIYNLRGKVDRRSQIISPFLRRLESFSAKQEKQNISTIISNNSIEGEKTLVRTVSFSTDAKIMDGISKLSETNLSNARQIKAKYLLERDRVYIGMITVDGKHAIGKILLSDKACSL